MEWSQCHAVRVVQQVGEPMSLGGNDQRGSLQNTQLYRPVAGASRLAVVVGTVVAMAVVAGVWLGLGFVWSSVLGGSAVASDSWPLLVHGTGAGASIFMLARRRVRAIPTRWQRFTMSSQGAFAVGIAITVLRLIFERLFPWLGA